jgi:hypothetical protein
MASLGRTDFMVMPTLTEQCFRVLRLRLEAPRQETEIILRVWVCRQWASFWGGPVTEAELKKHLDDAEQSPKQIAAVVLGPSEKTLRHKPSPDKWCILGLL